MLDASQIIPVQHDTNRWNYISYRADWLKQVREGNFEEGTAAHTLQRIANAIYLPFLFIAIFQWLVNYGVIPLANAILFAANRIYELFYTPPQETRLYEVHNDLSSLPPRPPEEEPLKRAEENRDIKEDHFSSPEKENNDENNTVEFNPATNTVCPAKPSPGFFARTFSWPFKRKSSSRH